MADAKKQPKKATFLGGKDDEDGGFIAEGSEFRPGTAGRDAEATPKGKQIEAWKIRANEIARRYSDPGFQAAWKGFGGVRSKSDLQQQAVMRAEAAQTHYSSGDSSGILRSPEEQAAMRKAADDYRGGTGFSRPFRDAYQSLAMNAGLSPEEAQAFYEANAHTDHADLGTDRGNKNPVFAEMQAINRLAQAHNLSEIPQFKDYLDALQPQMTEALGASDQYDAAMREKNSTFNTIKQFAMTVAPFVMPALAAWAAPALGMGGGGAAAGAGGGGAAAAGAGGAAVNDLISMHLGTVAGQGIGAAGMGGAASAGALGGAIDAAAGAGAFGAGAGAGVATAGQGGAAAAPGTPTPSLMQGLQQLGGMVQEVASRANAPSDPGGVPDFEAGKSDKVATQHQGEQAPRQGVSGGAGGGAQTPSATSTFLSGPSGVDINRLRNIGRNVLLGN